MENHISDKGLLLKTYKDFLPLHSKNKKQKHYFFISLCYSALQIVLPAPLAGICRYNYLHHFPCPIFISKPALFFAFKSLSLCSVTLGYIWSQYTHPSLWALLLLSSLSGMLVPCFPLTSTTSLAKYWVCL